MLSTAIHNGDLSMVRKLIDGGISTFALVSRIPNSATSGHLKRWLDEWGTRTLHRDMTALNYAVECDGPSAPQILGFVLDKLSQMVSSMLEILGSAHTIKSINTSRLAAENKGTIQLRRADSIDSAAPLNYTPLAWAVILGNHVGVERLIHAGAMVNSRDGSDGHIALAAQSILSTRDGYSMSST
jgi:hypothetical protein